MQITILPMQITILPKQSEKNLFIHLWTLSYVEEKFKNKISVIMNIYLYRIQRDNTMHVNFVRRKLPFFWNRLRNVYSALTFFMPWQNNLNCKDCDVNIL